MFVQILALAIGQISQIADFPYQPTAYSPEGAAAIELAIVRYVKRHPNEERRFESSDGKCEVTVAVDEVKVLDSTMPLEKTAFVVTPFRGGFATPFRNNPSGLRELKPGRNYLLATCNSPASSLQLPQPGFILLGPEVGDIHRYATITPRKRANEILGLAVFETKEIKLQTKELSAMDRLMLNITLCLRGANLETVQQVCTFLGYSQYGNFRNPGPAWAPHELRMTAVPANAPFIPVLQQAIKTHGPSNAARIAIILAHWKVVSGSDLLFDALRKATSDPNLFCQRGDFSMTVSLSPTETMLVEADKIERSAQILDLAIAAKSPTVQSLAFNNTGYKLDYPRQLKALEIAAICDESMSNLILSSIARWHDDDFNVPKFELVKGIRIFTNRVELIQYWRNVLGG